MTRTENFKGIGVTNSVLGVTLFLAPLVVLSLPIYLIILDLKAFTCSYTCITISGSLCLSVTT
jgi:hypothetical protein